MITCLLYVFGYMRYQGLKNCFLFILKLPEIRIFQRFLTSPLVVTIIFFGQR